MHVYDPIYWKQNHFHPVWPGEMICWKLGYKCNGEPGLLSHLFFDTMAGFILFALNEKDGDISTMFNPSSTQKNLYCTEQFKCTF